ncbi:MAG: hypothetical protein ACNYPI_00865 [Arenicellales bacterium WSBS_2016_MAG_OTU3]
MSKVVVVKKVVFAASLGVASILAGCAAITPPEPLTKQNSSLTQGNIQLNMTVGKTNKAEVLETFGAPNITTRDGAGREVDTSAPLRLPQSSSQSSSWTLILAGKSSSASGFESGSRMTTLIIKFDGNDVVSDFRSRTSDF